MGCEAEPICLNLDTDYLTTDTSNLLLFSIVLISFFLVLSCGIFRTVYAKIVLIPSGGINIRVMHLVY